MREQRPFQKVLSKSCTKFEYVDQMALRIFISVWKQISKLFALILCICIEKVTMTTLTQEKAHLQAKFIILFLL